MTNLRDGFNSLHGSPSELWKAYAMKLLASFSYFSLSLTFTLFLSDDFGFSDVEAGTIYGAWGALISIYGIFTGFLVDRMGVAQSLRLGFLITTIARLFIFLTTSRTVLLVMVLVVLPIGNSLGIPVLTTAIRRYTYESNRSFAFALFYVVMHFGCLLAGPFVDACTIKYSENEQSYLTQSLSSLSIISIDWTFSGYRMVVFAGLLASFAGLAVALSVREIKMSEVVPSMLQESMKGEGMERTGTPFIPKKEVSPFVPLKGNLWETTKETLSSKKFRGFMVVILVSLNVRLLFRHTDATLPKYMRREFGEDVPFGTIYSIGPLIAIVLVPLISAYTTKVSPLLMILVGMWISAASVFFVAFSTTVWATICFIIVLEIGECVWSPSLYNYAVSASQEGREGMYMSLSSAPLFLAKLPAGYMSGKLLEIYCPAEGPRNSQMMWLIIGCISLASPLLLSLFWIPLSKLRGDDMGAMDEATSRFATWNAELRLLNTTDGDTDDEEQNSTGKTIL